MAVIVGLEGVLARHEWRTGLIEAEGWDAYHVAAAKDAPNHPVVQLVNALHAKGRKVYCVADRPERFRMMTIGWMVAHGIMVDTLLLRAENDWRRGEEMHAEMVQGIVQVAGSVLLAIDDNDKDCEVYRAAGIPTLQIFNPNNGEG